jgi:hypothetical protein
MSARKRVLECAIRNRVVTVEILRGFFPDLSVKTIEAALRNLERDKLIKECPAPFSTRAKHYAPTALAARKNGLDERRFERGPRAGVVPRRLAISLFVQQTGYSVWMRHEFTALFPALAECKELDHNAYVVDWNAADPVVYYTMVDQVANLRYLLRRVRREWSKRKRYQAWRDHMYHGLFKLVLITLSESKAADIRRRLARTSTPCDVVAVPGIDRFFLKKEGYR